MPITKRSPIVINRKIMANSPQPIGGFICGLKGIKKEDTTTNKINPTRNNFHLPICITSNVVLMSAVFGRSSSCGEMIGLVIVPFALIKVK